MDKRVELEAIFRAGVEACHPSRLLAPHLPAPPAERTILLALGKGAAAMATAFEETWRGPLSGLCVTSHGTTASLERIGVMTSAHPVPDAASVESGRRLLALARDAGPDDLVVVLLSGGASALASLPAEGLRLEEKQRLIAALLRSGAAIDEVNCVRRHLSAFKGGRLGAAAFPARLVTLAISDVAGDAPEDIGSGPTVADASTIEDARAVLRRYGIDEPGSGWSESVKPEATREWRSEYQVIGSGHHAVDAAAAKAASLLYVPQVVYECSGEARQVARQHAELLRQAAPRTAFISGGELTVSVRGGGSGGPNQEYALALAMAMRGRSFAALAADTDGIDGSSDAAGAYVDGTTLMRGGDAERALEENGSGGFFAALGDLFVTGATGTNVNDLRIVLVGP